MDYHLSGQTLYLNGAFVLSEIDAILPGLVKELQSFKASALTVELDGVTELDSAGVAVLYDIKAGLEDKGVALSFKGGSDKVNTNLQLFSYQSGEQKDKTEKQGIFERTGEYSLNFLTHVLPEFLYFTADLFYWSIIDLFKRKTHRKGELVNQAIQIGVNAVPIVTIMTFLIGAVLAMQSAYQLRSFGANIFIVDLTVIAMMREMGPLITAILVAGRSGSAIASEVATMKITEELDALKTMGLNPVRFVMVPKMQASVMTIPFLTILADVAGIAGGMVIAYFFLDISPLVFFNRMGETLLNRDIFTGILKSLVFAIIIVQVGSYAGSTAERGATDVGRVTTKSVVMAIAMVILADSILGLILY